MRKLTVYLGSAMLLVASSGLAQANFDKGAAAYKRGDYQTALAVFRPLAENGDAKAQSILGLMYSYGEGVPEDYRESARWYRRAAEQNSSVAQYNLGMLYLEGKGVPQDTDEAIKWLDRAAEGGHFRARTTLAKLDAGTYSNQESGPSDALEAPPTMAAEPEPRSVVLRKPALPTPRAMIAAAPATTTKTDKAPPATMTKSKDHSPASNNTQHSANTPPASTSTTHEYRVQLAASRSEENIRRDWSSYQSRYSDIFGALDASVERAEVGEEKTVWYRLRVGPFESVSSAKELCETLSARGIKTGCLPLRVSR
jgi:uncharacterized protein